MKRIFIFLFLFLGFSSCMVKEKGEPVGNDRDRAFVTTAAQSYMGGAESARLAIEKESGLTALGEMILAMHQSGHSQLKDAASGQKFELPAALDSVHSWQISYLSSLSGHSFDSCYIHMQQANHAALISAFELEIAEGHNEPIRNYARTHLPEIKGLLHHIDSTVAHY